MQSIQLNLFATVPQNDTQVVELNSSVFQIQQLNYIDREKAKRLRQLANKMQQTIDAKKNSATSQQRPTARRARIAQAMFEEGARLEQIQSWLNAIADACDTGTLPKVLNQITSRTQLEIFLTLSRDNWSNEDKQKVFISKSYETWRKSLAKAGIFSVAQTDSAITALNQLHDCSKTDSINLQIRRLEQDLIGCKISGYFPTPKKVVQQMIELAQIVPGMRVLEPSAGKGDIAEKIRAIADVRLDVVEIVPQLQNILGLKEFNLVGHNFLTDISGEQYDRIIMNPPFEKYQEIDHVLYAYSCLLPGGRLVAIVSDAVSYRKEEKYSQFRGWLADVDANNYEMPDGAFLASDRPTSVKTRLLVIDKLVDSY